MRRPELAFVIAENDRCLAWNAGRGWPLARHVKHKEVTLKIKSKYLLSGVLAASALAFSAVNASAAIVCSEDTCWHVHQTYDYPPTAHVTVHEDDWRAGPGITFREHEGRGYWSGDRWTEW